MWGETATQNHEGGCFAAGQIVGTVLQTAIMLGANPCAMSTFGRLAYRVYQGIDFISDGVGAYNDVMAGH